MHRPKNPTEGPFHMKYTKEEKIAWAKETVLEDSHKKVFASLMNHHEANL